MNNYGTGGFDAFLVHLARFRCEGVTRLLGARDW